MMFELTWTTSIAAVTPDSKGQTREGYGEYPCGQIRLINASTSQRVMNQPIHRLRWSRTNGERAGDG